MKTKLGTFIFLLKFSVSFSQTLFNKGYQFGIPPSYFLKTIQLPDKGYFLYGGDMYPTAGFLSKIDSDGTMLWAKKIENPDGFTVPVLYSAIIDYDNNVLVTTQDPYPITGSLLKLDTAGNALWDLRFEFPISDIVVTTDSNYAVVGRKNLAVFGQNAEIQFYKISPSDSVIFKYEYSCGSGNYNNGEKNTYGLIQYPDGNFFILAHINEDIVIMKLDANGQVIWNKKYWQTVLNSAYVLKNAPWKMSLMADNTILVCGQKDQYFSHDLVCFKINSDGNVIWSNEYSPGGFNQISQIHTTLNTDSSVCVFLALTDSSAHPRDHVIFKIDQGGNLLDTFSLRIPGKPAYPMWFGQDPPHHYSLIQMTGYFTGDTMQITLMDSLFHSPCVTDTFASLTMQNILVTVLDSTPVVPQIPTQPPFSDTLIFTFKNFSNIELCSPAGISAFNISEEDLLVYPNPFQDKLNITIGENKIVEMNLYDVTSRKILNQWFSTSTSINTERLAKGLYVYEVRNKNGMIKKGKVVKE